MPGGLSALALRYRGSADFPDWEKDIALNPEGTHNVWKILLAARGTRSARFITASRPTSAHARDGRYIERLVISIRLISKENTDASKLDLERSGLDGPRARCLPTVCRASSTLPAC